MNRKYLFALGLMMLMHCVREDVSHGDDATLTGYDFRKCVCCGGTFIELKGTTYRFAASPRYSDVVLDENVQFPMRVHVLWKKVSSCSDAMIEVSELYRVP